MLRINKLIILVILLLILRPVICFAITYELEGATIGDSGSIFATPYSPVFGDDGSLLFVASINPVHVRAFELSTPFNVSTAVNIYNKSMASATIPKGIAFNDNGSKAYIADGGSDYIYQYELNAPWNLSSAGAYSKRFDVNPPDTTVTAMYMKSNGLAAYYVGLSTDTVRHLILSSADDISTATEVGSFSVNANETVPQGLTFSSDGLKFYVIGGKDRIFQYSMSTAWNVTTASSDYGLYVNPTDSTPYGLTISDDDSSLFFTGEQRDKIFEVILTPVGGTDTCTYSGSGNWEIDLEDNCVINTNYNLPLNNITFTNTGTVSFNSSINMSNMGTIINNQLISILSNTRLYITGG